MISETFTFAEPLIVDHWLDHLLTPLDKAYGRGTLQDRVVTVCIVQGTAFGKIQNSLYGQVLVRDGRWIDGLTVDHINHDPTDNRRENLRMSTRQENTKNRRNWREMPHLYEPIEKELGIRLYKFSFNIELDDDNSDLLILMYRKYYSGALLYGVGHTLHGYGSNQSSGGGLHARVLKANGVAVPKGMWIDHKNGNAFDNRFDNLEVVTKEVNQQRRSDRKKLLTAQV